MNPKNADLDYISKRHHTASHIMTMAVKMLHKDVYLGVGPWTDSGFYQDYDFQGEKISADDFKKIEKKMRWIVNKDFKVVRRIVSPEDAREYFPEDPYKNELIDGIVERGEDLTFYDFQDDEGNVKYTDLCAGPHVESTGKVPVFKLTKLAGAYWRGDENNPQLTRIYGVSFETKEEVAEYDALMAEIAKRDHRKLGAELDLFTFSDIVGSGLPLFTPKGTFIRETITQTINDIQEKYGFERVSIPHITKKDLYEKSGHWGKYKDDLFHVKGKGDTEFVMKPMNCPHHSQIFKAKLRSYRDLPQRYAECTMVYRDEQPGELLGLSRVRSISQDDGHIFCRIDQVKEEANNIVNGIKEFYTKMGMFGDENYWVSLSVRDPEKPEKYLGDSENWDKAEKFLEEVAEGAGLNYERVEGEAAFYGPKLDFQFKDALGREWQLATVQVDFVQPERLELEYVNEEGKKERPVMIHRAIAGSLERFMSVIIEHFGGCFPLWLAPVQAYILPVNDAHLEYAQNLVAELKAVGARVELHEPNQSLGKRIRNAQTMKIPFSVVIGDNEVETNELTLRAYGENKDSKRSREEFIKNLGEK